MDISSYKMFVLRNVGKLLFGDFSKEFIVELPQGQLYLVRPSSPKGYSELIFKDAAAQIQRTNQDFQYQLVIQRAYEEGEADLGEDENSEGGQLSVLSTERDEKTFLLDKSLHFRSVIRKNGDKVLAWRDLSGDTGDIYQFVCDHQVDEREVLKFEAAAQKCQYEREYRKSHTTATKEDLAQFCFDSESTIPSASPISCPVSYVPNISPVSLTTCENTTMSPSLRRDPQRKLSSSSEQLETLTNPKASNKTPNKTIDLEAMSIICKETAELHLYGFETETFILQDAEVEAVVSEVGIWEYQIEISNGEKFWLKQAIIADINPVFNFEYLSFIFNAYSENGDAYSWLLRFKDIDVMNRFQDGLMRALWEHQNETKWVCNNEYDRKFILEAFEDLALQSDDEKENDEEDEQEEEEEIKGDENNDDDDDAQRSEHYDTDEEDDDVNVKPNDGNENSLLAVGYKNDRSFVVRGSKIGVFKHTRNNYLEFCNSISNIETPKGKVFSPKKVMLHEEDSQLVLQDDANPHSLYRMDLEYGKVVDEWKVHPDIQLETYNPENKFAQMTSEKTFIGLSKNSLFRIDPRLAGNKLVDSQFKQYLSANEFSATATTENGHIAVASSKGDIRLFDRLGINAKTLIPALCEPIIGLDVSADGRWVLATCRTCLLLVDTLQKEGKNNGKLGFEKPFPKDSKPQPRRLGLTPEHVAQFRHETGCPLSFTTAHFNTGEGLEETSIISATGPFVITWSMKKVLTGSKDPYTIKRYTEEVKADNFRYGSDMNVIVTLPNDVNMVAKKSLRKPTRESIMSPSRISDGNFYGSQNDVGRIGTRNSARYKLGKDSIVNSPY